MNLVTMRGMVVGYLGLQDLVNYDEQTLVDNMLYQGTLDLLSRTRCVVRCVQLNVQANVDEYTLDQAILSLFDVDNGSRRRMRRDQAEAYAANPASPAQWYPGTAQNDWVQDTGFVLIRSDVLRIVPMPSEDGTVQVWAVMKPQPMTLDADSPSDEAHGAIPEEFHDAILTYALWKCADYADDQTTQYGEYYRALYEGSDGRGGRLGQIKVLINRRGTSRAPRSQVRLNTFSPPGAFT